MKMIRASSLLALITNSAQAILLDTEAGRYVDSSGNPVNLAETSGHARMVLHRVDKYNG